MVNDGIDLEVEATRCAARHGIDGDLVRAIVRVESGWNPLAMRFEPDWPYFLAYHEHAGVVSEATERMQQATSWGLMQVMGTVARELGCDEPFLSVLCRPGVGLEYGCKKLAQLLGRYESEVDAVAAYNAGSPRRTKGHFVNQWYVDKVYRNRG